MQRRFTKTVLFAAAAALALTGAAEANAATLFSIAPDLTASQNGNCVYNSTCGQINYAGQLFTLDASSIVTDFGFNAIVLSNQFGTAVNYRILNTTASNTPGSLVTAGTAALTHTAGPQGNNFATTNYSFNVAPLNLAAGNYVLAFQNVTTGFADYLSKGVGTSGAFLSSNNGATFAAGYQGYNSVAISVGGTAGAVPEPATWAMMILGMGAIGFAMRRRNKNVSTTVRFA